MRGRIVFILLTVMLAGGVLQAGVLLQKFEKSTFYRAMASGNLADVNAQLDAVHGAPATDREGYEGALLMRKAGLVSKPKDKLQYFKRGRIKFQTAYNADSTNTEFHFLRLTIQENAPKIVKYRSDLKADRLFVKEHFKNLSPAVQHVVLEYSKTSKVLRPEDF